MHFTDFIGRVSRPLLASVCLAVLLILSAGPAYAYGIAVDVKPDNPSVVVNSTTSILITVYDVDHSEWKFKDATGILTVTHPSGTGIKQTFTTNDSGMFSIPFKPTSVGNYTFEAAVSYNYTKAFNYPAGVLSTKSQPVTLTSRASISLPGGIGRITAIPGSIVTPTAAPQSPTPTPSPVTPTPVPPTATPAATTTPGSATDVTAPVTTLNLTGTLEGNDTYVSDALCTLTARDNEGGSGVSIIQYSFDGSSWFTYQQPFSVVRPGVNTVYYRSADNAGNVEVANVKAVIIAAPGSTPTPAPSVSPSATATPGPSVEITALALASMGALLLAFRSAGKP